MELRTYLIRLKSLEDLVKIACTSSTAVIYYLRTRSKKNVYFCYTISGGTIILHYIELDRPIEKKYVAYSSFDGRLFFADKPSADARLHYIPVIEIESQSLVPEEVF